MSRAGQLLLVEGLVSEGQLGKASELQRALGGTIGQNLVRVGAVTEAALAQVFCAHLGLEPLDQAVMGAVRDQVAALVPSTLAVDNRVVPVALNGDWLILAMSDPSDDETIAEVSRLTGFRLQPRVATESQVSRALERLYGTANPGELSRGTGAPLPEPVKVEPIELRPSRKSALPDKTTPADAEGYSEPDPSSPGGYERIRPEDLPEDASAGFIPLTNVKREGTPPPTPVIEVRSVQIGPSPETRAEGEPPAPGVQRPRPAAARQDGKDPSTWEAPVAPPAREVPPATAPPHDEGGPEVSSRWDIPEDPAPSESDRPDSWDPAPHDAGVRGHRTLPDAVRELETVPDRDAAVTLALDVLLARCRRTAFFTVKRSVVEGFDAAGEGIDRHQVRVVWIPLASPCTLRDVCEYRQPRVGPVGDGRADAIFVAALGGRHGDSIMVPVVTGDKVVAVLYGDDLKDAAPSMGELERLGDALGAAFERILTGKRRKIQ